MFQIFRPHRALIKGVVHTGQYDYIRTTYEEKLQILRNYYQDKAFYLKNNHVLVRLLNNGLGSLHTDYQTFVNTASDRTNNLIRISEFTGSVNYGKIWYRDFYGEGSHEIIIGDNPDFNIDHVIKNWKIATPVRLLTHSISDFGLSLPNGRTNHFLEGLSVIYINIPMLFLVYRLFIEEQLRNERDGIGEGSTSPKLFIYRYILPGMMFTQIDHVFVNRIMNLFDGKPMTELLVRSPFHQAETGNAEGSGLINMVNKSQEQILHKLTTSQVDYEQALANIYTPTHLDALQLLKMPDIAPTRQVWWAMLLSRMKHIHFLLKISKENNANQNRLYHNRAVIDLSRLLDSHVLERMFRADLLESIIGEVNETLELASA